jgi:hypothetical protein
MDYIFEPHGADVLQRYPANREPNTTWTIADVVSPGLVTSKYLMILR